MRLLFLGTPEFAAPSLRALLASRHEVVGVVAQPSRPSGRGLTITDPPTIALARERGVATFQPTKLHSAETLESFRTLRPDLIVTAAFGRLLRPSLLTLPARGCWNLHASLLPRHRGAAPVSASLLSGDRWTGVTLFQLDEGMDTGPMLHQRMLAIAPAETAGELTARLADLAAETLLEGLALAQSDRLTALTQSEEGATYTKLLTKEDGRLRFDRPAEQVDRWVRAVTPWPGAFVELAGKRLRVHRAQPWHELPCESAPGTVLSTRDRFVVACLPGAIVFEEVQSEGRKRQPALEWLRGAAISVGDRFA